MDTILFEYNNQRYSIELSWRKTRNGFAHDSFLLKESPNQSALFFIMNKKQSCFYINRTWESYQFKSVIHKLIRANFDDLSANAILLDIDKRLEYRL
jgi:hypothetical protein